MKKLILIVFLSLLFSSVAVAQDPDDPLECDGVTWLEVDPIHSIGWCWTKHPPEEMVDHYTVHKSMVSGVVGEEEIFTLPKMDCKTYICETPVGWTAPDPGIYYFVVIAHDAVGHESGPSNETTLVVRPPIDLPPPYDLRLTVPAT